MTDKKTTLRLEITGPGSYDRLYLLEGDDARVAEILSILLQEDAEMEERRADAETPEDVVDERVSKVEDAVIDLSRKLDHVANSVNSLADKIPSTINNNNAD